ncbi:MAG: hypothetical protein F6K31_00335 [Symploca sp. SIO2G7]|nr:hypothetical protein [Symploca sp. SIO2G7]
MTAAYVPTLLEKEDSSQTSSVYNRYYFQILTFDELTDDFKLVYGSKAALEKEYGLEPGAFPTFGVHLREDFLTATPEDGQIEEQQKIAEAATIRFLLQSRKLSQIMTYTWLDQDKIEKWVKAEENTIEGNDYPFYPEKGTSEWNNKELGFIQPPYPYIPLSSS